MKRLVLINKETKTAYCPEQCSCCSYMDLYYTNSLVNRFLRKMILSLNLPGKKLVLNKWTDEIRNSDEIIVFDTGNAVELIRWIKKKVPEKRVIFWYWNPVVNSIPVDKAKQSGAELWSFDPKDCKKYGLRYNSQYYMRENLLGPDEEKKEPRDVFYVGKDKDRAETLYRLKQVFDENGITFNIHLVQYNKQESCRYFEYKELLKYHEVLQNIAASKAIIDLVSEEQSGLTIRPIEALLYKKKLITDMKGISAFKIYNPNNVFILGVDNMEDLPAFIRSPFDEKDYDSLCDFYLMEAWLERFDMENGWFDYKDQPE